MSLQNHRQHPITTQHQSGRPAWKLAGTLLILTLPLVILIPGLVSFPYPPASEGHYSDLVLTHYPYAIFLRNTILEQHTLPLWSPTILSGHPFAANPLSGIWYPPGWIALLFPLPFGFNLLIVLHLLWGGCGALLFLQQQGLAIPAALLGALAFTAMPKIFAHYGAGHLTLLYAISWTPWLLWTVGWDWAPGKYWLQAVILSLIFTADPRWALYAGALWLGCRIFVIDGSQPKSLFKRTADIISQVLLAALLTAPFALPMLEFASLSSRGMMNSSDIFIMSLPPARLIGLLFPDFGGFHEWMLYPGAAVVVLTLLVFVRAPGDHERSTLRKVVGFIWFDRNPGERFWGLVLFVSLLFSFGDYFPPLTLFARLPFFNLLRVPSRALFLVGISFSFLAAYGVDYLIEVYTEHSRRSANLVLFALFSVTVMLVGVVTFLTGEIQLSFLWGGIMVTIASIWIGLRLWGRIGGSIWFVGLLVICLSDWGFVDRSLFMPRPISEVMDEGQTLVRYLAEQPGNFRVYSPSYSLPQQTAVNFGLELADGVDPLQLQSYVDFMQSATGVPFDSYSVTMPPFVSGHPETDNKSYLPDTRLLGLLNVEYIAAEFDLSVDGLSFQDQFDETRIYKNLYSLPRAWVQPLDTPVGIDIWSVIEMSRIPNEVRIKASGPGMLVLSELSYPGWQVCIDGQAGEIKTLADLLRGVELTTGDHEVLFSYRPPSLYLGSGLFILALVYIGFRLLRGSR